MVVNELPWWLDYYKLKKKRRISYIVIFYIPSIIFSFQFFFQKYFVGMETGWVGRSRPKLKPHPTDTSPAPYLTCPDPWSVYSLWYHTHSAQVCDMMIPWDFLHKRFEKSNKRKIENKEMEVEFRENSHKVVVLGLGDTPIYTLLCLWKKQP